MRFGFMDCTALAEDRDKLQALINTEMYLRESAPWP
jgi:hypothetical protein